VGEAAPRAGRRWRCEPGGGGGGVVSRHQEWQAPRRERGGREKESEEGEKKVLSNLNPLIFGDHDVCCRK
jgi:hypothetical protein